MTTRDLVLEFKANIQDLQKEKADMAKTIASKESRIKQILIKLEQSNSDLEHAGKHAAKVQKDNDALKADNTTLKAKLETTEKLLETDTKLDGAPKSETAGPNQRRNATVGRG